PTRSPGTPISPLTEVRHEFAPDAFCLPDPGHPGGAFRTAAGEHGQQSQLVGPAHRTAGAGTGIDTPAGVQSRPVVPDRGHLDCIRWCMAAVWNAGPPTRLVTQP